MFERFTAQARRVVVQAQEEAWALDHDHIGTEHILLALIREDDGVPIRALRALGISPEAVRQRVGETFGQGQQAEGTTDQGQQGAFGQAFGQGQQAEGITDQGQQGAFGQTFGSGQQGAFGQTFGSGQQPGGSTGQSQQAGEVTGQGQQRPSRQIAFTAQAKSVLALSLREALQLGHDYIGAEHILLGLIREGDGAAAQVLVGLGADLNRVRLQVIEEIKAQPDEARLPPGPAASGVTKAAKTWGRRRRT